MTQKNRIGLYLFTGWACLAAAYLLCVFPHLRRPIVGWEALVWEVPATIATKGFAAVRFFYLPPLYDSLIALSFKVLGIAEISARIPGIVCFLMMPALVYLLAEKISSKEDRRPTAVIAAILFATSPLVAQGSLLIDRSDTTVLTLALLLFYLVLLGTEGRPLLRRIVPLSALYALCLWTKVTTPLACLAAVPLVYALCRRFREGVLLSAGVFGIGAALFALTWGLFCLLAASPERFIEPFRYYAAAASSTTTAIRSGILIKMALDIFRIYLWFSPFLLALAGLAATGIFKRLLANRPDDRIVNQTQLLVFIAIVAGGYLYTNATFSGFPKYVAPIMPMLACLSAQPIWRAVKEIRSKRLLIVAISMIGCGVVYHSVFVKDWIYAVFALRSAELNGTIRQVIGNTLFQQGCYVFFPFAMILLLVKVARTSLINRTVLALGIALIAGNISMSIIQRNAVYSVNFAYGTEGADRLRTFLRASAPKRVLTSIEGYVANVGSISFQCVDAGVWNSPGQFLKLIDSVRPECLIYGLAVNTVSQLKGTLTDPAVTAYLSENYKSLELGSYTVLFKDGQGSSVMEPDQTW